MNLAMQAWRSGDGAQALALLEAQRGASPENDLRGFDWYYLWGLCQPGQRQFLRGHTGSLRQLAFSPDGASLASAAWDNTVRIWDVDTAKQKRVLTGHKRSPWNVTYSPDGRFLASGGLESDCVMLWDANTGQRLHAFPGSFFDLAFSADSKKLAGGLVVTPDKVPEEGIDAKVWDVETKAELATLKTAGVVVGFLQDGKSLVTLSRMWASGTEAQICGPADGQETAFPARNRNG